VHLFSGNLYKSETLKKFFKSHLCISLTFDFDFGAFKSLPQNFGFHWTDSKFQNFGLGDAEN
jgi:hypothetical protein